MSNGADEASTKADEWRRLFKGNLNERSSDDVLKCLNENGFLLEKNTEGAILVKSAKRSEALARLAKKGLPKDEQFLIASSGHERISHIGPVWTYDDLPDGFVSSFEQDVENFIQEIDGVISVSAIFDPKRTGSEYFETYSRFIFFIEIEVKKGKLSAKPEDIARIVALIGEMDIEPEQIFVQITENLSGLDKN